ncbi:21022_t:CDS:2, partial [Rhizophagus irregularis]
STITDILKESERWLTITESQENVKKFRGPKWPQLEDALGLWVDNALNTKQDIDGNILKMKASYFAEQFSIEDFHHSEGWLGGFKKRHSLCQFKKQGEAESAPSAESIERDRLALQQFLTTYNPEDIWNGDETGLFWKMEPSRINAYDDVQDGIVEELADYTIYDALQNAAEAWSMVTSQTISNCWKKTGILPQSDEFEELSDDNDSVLSDSFDIEINELEVLISQFPKSDLNAYEYLHIEDEIPEGGLTDHEIVDTIRNANREEENVVDEIELTHIMEKISPTEVEKAIDKTIRFLYEQGPEFGEVNEELKILRRLHKKVK